MRSRETPLLPHPESPLVVIGEPTSGLLASLKCLEHWSPRFWFSREEGNLEIHSKLFVGNLTHSLKPEPQRPMLIFLKKCKILNTVGSWMIYCLDKESAKYICTQNADIPTYFRNKVLLDTTTIFVYILCIDAFFLLWHSWVMWQRPYGLQSLK